MTLNVRKKKNNDDIMSFNQTLNYAFVHSTKRGSEAHSVVRRIMRQSSGFDAWRQLTLCRWISSSIIFSALLRTIMQSSWNSTTKQFTRQD
eukprot:709730-Amphidinium_carterae.1